MSLAAIADHDDSRVEIGDSGGIPQVSCLRGRYVEKDAVFISNFHRCMPCEVEMWKTASERCCIMLIFHKSLALGANPWKKMQLSSANSTDACHEKLRCGKRPVSDAVLC